MKLCGYKSVGDYLLPSRHSKANTLAGSFSELLGNLEEATSAYEHALRANPRSVAAMNAISCILRTQEQFHKAVEYLQNILKLEGNNGEVWGSLGIFFASFRNQHSDLLFTRTLLFNDG